MIGVTVNKIPASYLISIDDLRNVGLFDKGPDSGGGNLFSITAHFTRADLESLILQLSGQLAKLDQDEADKKAEPV